MIVSQKMRHYACVGKHVTSGFSFCEECFRKQLIIDQLKTEMAYLKAQLRYRKKKDNQLYFGSSTPSSKLKFKENALEDDQTKVGGRKPGHHDNGRRKWSESEVDAVIDLKVELS